MFTQTAKRWSWTNRANGKAGSAVPPGNINFLIPPPTPPRYWLEKASYRLSMSELVPVERRKGHKQFAKGLKFNSRLGIVALLLSCSFSDIQERNVVEGLLADCNCVRNVCVAFCVLPSATTLHCESHDTRIESTVTTQQAGKVTWQAGFPPHNGDIIRISLRKERRKKKAHLKKKSEKALANILHDT